VTPAFFIAGLKAKLFRLPAELRLAAMPGPAAVEPVAAPEVAGELAVDEGGEAAVDAVRREVVGRAHDVHQRLDELCFVGAERLIANQCGGGGRGRGCVCSSGDAGSCFVVISASFGSG
jgi:hypothetical protein